MTISNTAGYSITYNVRDKNNLFNDGGTLNPTSYVEYQPRGQAPFTVTLSSITLQNVPSPAAIVSFWNGGGGFSQ